MARIGKRGSDGNSPQENEPTEPTDETSPAGFYVEEDEVSLPGETDDPMTAFENKEQESIMTDVQEVEVPTNGAPTNDAPNGSSDEAESLLTGEMKRIADEASGEAFQLLSVDDLPKDARIVRSMISLLHDLEADYKEAAEELRKGTSGKDEKVQHFIANLPEGSQGAAIQDAIVSMKEERIKLDNAIQEREAELLAHAEAELSAEGGTILSESEIEAKMAELKSKFSEYQDQFRAAKNTLNNYREQKNPNAGEIHQYVRHIDRPGGRKVKADGASNSGGGTAYRSVHVSSADYSTDNGATWNHIAHTLTSGITLSNPAGLAAKLSSEFKTKVEKDAIVDAWYSENGQTRETASKDTMRATTEFPFTFKLEDGSDKTVMVRLTKRGAAS